VLIFGPLKSGKSTLMNAIAAAYVSEVSSLPAYPCLVCVRVEPS
jgi:ribosome biogenesis GTPase A